MKTARSSRRRCIRHYLHAPQWSGDCGRAGLTLIELLVALSVIGLLIAILAPAVMSARETARRATCGNNLKNVALAVVASTEAKRRFPAAGNFLVEPDSTGTVRRHNWVLDVLPHLEQSNIADQWDKNLAHSLEPNNSLRQTHIPVLTCPSDSSVTGGGDLSYVVNGGFGWTGPPGGVIMIGHEPVDLNGNGHTDSDPATDGRPSDQDLMKQTGLFFVENWPPGSGTTRHHSLNTVSDGTSQTLMLAECIHAGVDYSDDPEHPPDEAAGWADPRPWRTCFFVSGRVCENLICTPGGVDYGRANDHAGMWSGQSINGLTEPFEGGSPFPASMHPGGVFVAFADGRVQFLSETIAGGVYAALASPKGADVKGALAQQIVGDTEF